MMNDKRHPLHYRVVRKDGSIPLLGEQFADPALLPYAGQEVVCQVNRLMDNAPAHIGALDMTPICVIKRTRINTAFYANASESK